MSTKPILVTAATGKTGRRIAQQLEAGGVPVRRASRATDVPFDWDDPTTWDAVLEGIEAAYVAPAEGSLAVPAFVARAAELGVQQLVLLSARGVTTDGYYDNQAVLAPQHTIGERAVRESGLRWTILRPGWFSQNFSEGVFLPAILAGELALPTDDGCAAFVDADDIAAVAVAALLGGNAHHGRELELTGPSPVSIGEATRLIGKATGRTIKYRAISADDYHQRLLESGTDPHDAAVMTTALSPIRSGREGRTTPDVHSVLGRHPKTFSSFVNDAFARGDWMSALPGENRRS